MFFRLVSDYEVTLVNDSMQEFYVWFYGPSESAQSPTHFLYVSHSQRWMPSAPFAGGIWKIHVELPDQYPFKSPSIGFMNKIFHPNIDELCGAYLHATLCRSSDPLACPGAALSVWTSSTKHGHQCLVSRHLLALTARHRHASAIDMINIFEVFLPQLLRYPNPSDPLNGEAAALLMRHPKEYEQRVKGACFVIWFLQ